MTSASDFSKTGNSVRSSDGPDAPNTSSGSASHQSCRNRLPELPSEATRCGSSSLSMDHDEKWTLFQYDPVFFKEDKLDDQAYKDVKTLFSDLVADINSNLTNS